MAGSGICLQMDGMHLASMTTPEEYTLVSGFLAGDDYQRSDNNAFKLLAPCRAGSPLCIIYIGMKAQVEFPFLVIIII